MGNRSWTKILEAAGSRGVTHPRFEHQVTRRKLIAEMALTAITDGVIYYSDGSSVQIGSKEWMDFVKWLYTHIDGPAPTKMQLSTPDGESLKIEDVTLTTEQRLAKLNALYDSVRARAAGLAPNNGSSQPNGFHGAGLADS